MGKPKSPEQQVADYMMSIHFGVCHQADSIERIKINDKTVFEGRRSSNGSISVNKPGLFGGNKKEGGARGLIEVLLGAADQVLPARLASKLKGTPTSVPGFRGITSLFFTGGGPQATAGFYWTSNTPYLRPVDVTVRRKPKGFYPEKALVPETMGTYDPVERTHLDTTVASWGGLTVRIKRANSGGFVVESTGSGEERSYSSTGAYLSTTGPTGSPTPNIASVTPPAGYMMAGWLSGGAVFVKVTGTSFATEPCILRGQGLDYSLTTNITVNLPPSQKMIGLAICQESSVAMVMAKSGPSDPGQWFLIDSDGLVRASGAIGIPDVDQYTFGFGNLAQFHYASCSLEPNLSTVWVAKGAINTPVQYYRVDETGVLLFGGEQEYAVSEGGPFNRPSIWALDGAAYVTTGTGSAMMTAVFIRDKTVYDFANANPAHIIFECLTNNDWGLGLPVSQIDVPSFVAAADTLYDEALGLSMLWSNQSDIESFINSVLGHIDGTYGIDPATGKIYLSLVRGGYSTEGLFELTPDNCTVTRFQRKAISETVNEVTVTWTNPQNEQEETVTVHDLANYSLQGVLNSASSNYYGVRSAALASRLALRDLTRGAAPLAAIEVDADRSAWDKKPGEVVLLTYPQYGLAQLPVRVMSVDYGRPGASKVQLSLVEDVFNTPDSAYVEISSSLEDNKILPPTALEFIQTGAAPYYLLSQIAGSSDASATDINEAYSMILAASISQLSNIELQVARTNALGITEYVTEASLVVSGRAKLTASLPLEQISVIAPGEFTGNVAPVAGGLVWIGSGDPQLSELALISAVGTAITVFRGVLDTTPKAWPIGTPIWFITPGTELGDSTAHLNGQTVNYKLLPSNPAGTLDQDWAPVTPVVIDNRQHRPYRPANVKLNGAAWPTMVEGPVLVTWSRRNRLLEDPVIRQWSDADVTPETGQTVTATLRRVDTNAVLSETSAITGTSVTLTSTYSGNVSLTLTSVRDGLSSYQPFVHHFTLATLRRTEGGETRVFESGETRILEN